MTGYYTDSAPTPWTLEGPGITSVTRYSQCGTICGETLAMDELYSPQLSPRSGPEPSTPMLLATGAHALRVYRRVRAPRRLPL